MFQPTWLYIKQHDITGLKYFGKTIHDTDAYHGSGVYWTRHLGVHGLHVTTIWKQLFYDEKSLNEHAISFSVDNKIVESNEWANLKVEDGLMGGDTGITQEGRLKISKKSKAYRHSDATKEKIKQARANQAPTMLGKKHSEETKEKISKAVRRSNHVTP